ncbi:MAG: alpha/beta fold hydrolase [Chloroflexi bacterium]|nr:alpha/beta fold hydrolase [Chloroflexota bacterium]
METHEAPLERRVYELTSWRVPGPFEPIPCLLFRRADLTGPLPAVVSYHGVTQGKETCLDMPPIARRLADRGVAVLLPDAPGHGDRPSAATLTDRLRMSLPHEFCAAIEQSAAEAPALFDWLAVRPEVAADRLAVLGISMGGFTAAVVAARLRDRLRAAVCIAGAADLPTCMCETDAIGPGRWGPIDRSIDPETQARIARIDPLGYPDRFFPLPLLLVHGERDTWNPPVTSERFAAALRPYYAPAPDALRLVIIPGAPHWPPGPAAVREAVEWLSRALAVEHPAQPDDGEVRAGYPDRHLSEQTPEGMTSKE